MDTKHEGFINVWFPERAFGFIHENENGTLKVYFFHISSLLSGIPVKGATARFDVGENKKGPAAKNVEVTPDAGLNAEPGAGAPSTEVPR